MEPMTDISQAPRIQRREVWVDLPAEYAGFKVRIWVNPPSRLWADIITPQDPDETPESAKELTEQVKEDKRLAALKRIVLEHNGWVDYDGEVYPATNTKEFWDDIPDELAAVLLTVIQREMAKLPNSLIPKKRR